jgi:hypothetical protein
MNSCAVIQLLVVIGASGGRYLPYCCRVRIRETISSFGIRGPGSLKSTSVSNHFSYLAGSRTPCSTLCFIGSLAVTDGHVKDRTEYHESGNVSQFHVTLNFMLGISQTSYPSGSWRPRETEWLVRLIKQPLFESC